MTGVRGPAGLDRPIPADLVVGGEGGGAEELQGIKRYLLVGLSQGGGGRKRFVDVRRRSGTEELNGEGALVVSARAGRGR